MGDGLKSERREKEFGESMDWKEIWYTWKWQTLFECLLETNIPSLLNITS